MNELVFYISASSGLILSVLFLAPLLFPRFQFFPPPSKESWQYFAFWLLFRIMFLSLVALTILSFNPVPFLNYSFRYAVALPLMLGGFGLATYLSFALGWRNAHGEAKGLVKSGFYRFSRNPVYVTSIIGMLGWGLFANSLYVYVVLVFWAIMYIVSPFVEEQWLEKQYGSEFVAYKNQVPRFLGIPKKNLTRPSKTVPLRSTGRS